MILVVLHVCLAVLLAYFVLGWRDGSLGYTDAMLLVVGVMTYLVGIELTLPTDGGDE